MITHYDLFAGIGGFSLALDTVFYDHEIKHIFSEWEHFPTEVLKKHWPEGVFCGDIADLIANTAIKGRKGSSRKDSGRYGQLSGEIQNEEQAMVILTGGFPCQPFSQAGRRRGTSDDRYKWPEMLEVIRNVKPDWIIAENVRGLVTWNEGMVLEQVCADMENEGYEVQPLVIPAVAVNAPHRRDRVWIIANAINNRQGREEREVATTSDSVQEKYWQKNGPSREPERADSYGQTSQLTTDSRGEKSGRIPSSQRKEIRETRSGDWDQDWREVALATCHDGVDDGLSREVGGVSYSAAKYRKEALKAYGNAIVPQVAMQILEAIKSSSNY